MSVHEPPYTLEIRDGAFELRRYPARVVAETRVHGSFETAGNTGFRRLARYIFRGNRTKTPIAMTAPVGERAEGTGWVVTFTMPADATLASLPEPNDAHVALRALAPTTVAVARSRGRWRTDRFAAEAQALRTWARARGLAVVGEPEINRYDPPWKPWFLRRNEVWMTVAGASAPA